MHTIKWSTRIAIAVFVTGCWIPAQAQQEGLAQRVAALEALVVTLQTALNNEIAARQAADQTLQSNINAETAGRAAADADLLNHINSEAAARQAADTELRAQIAAIDTGGIPGLANYLTVDTTTHTVLFTGANLQIVNGLGVTNSLNRLGNLIVGYNEPRYAVFGPVCSDGEFADEASCKANGNVWAANHKSGSHNIVGGFLNSYSSYGGLIVGNANVINRFSANVTGGSNNIASGGYSTVSGGAANIASGAYSSVSGGSQNTASGFFSSVSGGGENTASGRFSSSVSGGRLNTASGQFMSSVSGGEGCTEARDFGWSVGDTTFDTVGCTTSNTP